MTAEVKQTQQPKKLGNSANIIIGKKAINSSDTYNTQNIKSPKPEHNDKKSTMEINSAGNNMPIPSSPRAATKPLPMKPGGSLNKSNSMKKTELPTEHNLMRNPGGDSADMSLTVSYNTHNPNSVKPSTLRTGSDIQNAIADKIQRGSEITAPQHMIKQGEDVIKGYQILSTIQAGESNTDMPGIIAPPFLSKKPADRNPAIKTESIEKADSANVFNNMPDLNYMSADKIDGYSHVPAEIEIQKIAESFIQDANGNSTAQIIRENSQESGYNLPAEIENENAPLPSQSYNDKITGILPNLLELPSELGIDGVNKKFNTEYIIPGELNADTIEKIGTTPFIYQNGTGGKMAIDDIVIRDIIPNGKNNDIPLFDEIYELPVEPGSDDSETPEFIQNGDDTQDTEKDVNLNSGYDETDEFTETARQDSVITELPQYTNPQSTPVKTTPGNSVSKSGSNVVNLLKAASPFMSDIKGSLQGELGKQGDIETAAASEVIKAGEYGVKSFKKAQDISTGIINKITGKPPVPKPKQRFKIARSGVRQVNKGISKVGDVMSASGDMGLESIGLSIKTIKYTAARVKTVPIAVKTTVGGVKTIVTLPIKTATKAYKTGKKVVEEVKRAQREGAKKTAKRYGEKALEEIEKAGRSVVNALINLVKKAGAKVVLPVILLGFFFIALFNIITAPVAGASAIFGNVFSIFDGGTNTYTDYEIRDYIRDAVIPKRIDYANQIANIRNMNLTPYGSYHYIRLFTENNDTPIDIMSMSVNIMDYIYTEDELAYIIEPLFNTIVFTKYGLEPTQAQADAVIGEIWDVLMDVKTKELPIEYCYGAVDTHYDCGAYLADISTCRNYTYGYHYTYTCDICCWVQDHYEWVYDDATDTYNLVHWTTDECNAYFHCGGHKILGVYQNVAADGMYELLIKYFLRPIDNLANMTARTDAQEEELQTLIDNYDLCLAYMEDVQEHYGINAGSPDISGVVFLPGSRPGNDNMVKTAKTQVGKKASSIYWSWQGITARDEWSASFVSWVAYSNGYIPGSSFPNFSDCNAGVTWFKNNSLWKKAKDYTEPVAGDIIFLDWSGNGTADRAGIVIGNDGEFVYTIEGNNGDVCRIKCYTLTSSLILGYGLPNY